MVKRTRVEPAPPITTEPRLQELEKAKRREIAKLKESSPDQGRQASLTTSVMLTELQAEVLCGKAVKAGGKKGEEAAHGTPEEKQRQIDSYRQAFLDLCRDTGWKHLTVNRKKVATHFGVNFKTIQRATTGMKKET